MFQWIERLNRPIVEKKLKWLSRIPLPVITGMCYVASQCVYLLTPGLRRKIITHMSMLFPEWSQQQKKHRAQRYIYHGMITLFEITFLTHYLDDHIETIFQTTGEERLKHALQQGRGVIIHAPHVGNFLYYYWYLSKKYDCFSVATAHPDLLPLYKRFERMGCKGIDYDSTPPVKILRQLKSHLAKNGVVFLFGDFYRPNFPASEWFNRQTKSPMGTVALAIEMECPVIPFYGKQLAVLSHEIFFGESFYLQDNFDKTDRAGALLCLNQLLENRIRLAPEQWFYWFNAGERFEESEQ